MRIRLFGHHLHIPLLILVVTEFAAFAAAMLLAAVLRLGAEPGAIEAELGPLWPRAFVFALAASISFLALGLYSIRERIAAFGVALRVVIASLAAMAVSAMVFYLIPSIEIGRGVLILATLMAIVLSLVIRSAAY